MSRRESIVDVLTSDQRAVAEDIAALLAVVSADGEVDVQPSIERLVMQMVGLLAAQEQYLLPLIRETLPGGDAAAGIRFDAHRRLEHTLRRLEDLENTPHLITPILLDVETSWRALTDYLDVEVFPALAREVAPERLAELGDDVLGALQTAPTRPRAFAPRSAAVSKVVSLATGFVDRARDAWADRGEGADDASDPAQDAP